jgi:hypothetical protein
MVLQIAVLFAAPVSACCGREDRDSPVAASAEVECCPPGSHPPGQCPLHKAKAARQRSECRMRCDARHAPDLILGVSGVLPRPVTTVAAPPVSVVAAVFDAGAVSRGRFPASPPPKASL